MIEHYDTMISKYGYESKPWYPSEPQITGKWMFIPPNIARLVLIHPHILKWASKPSHFVPRLSQTQACEAIVQAFVDASRLEVGRLHQQDQLLRSGHGHVGRVTTKESRVTPEMC